MAGVGVASGGWGSSKVGGVISHKKNYSYHMLINVTTMHTLRLYVIHRTLIYMHAYYILYSRLIPVV